MSLATTHQKSYRDESQDFCAITNEFSQCAKPKEQRNSSMCCRSIHSLTQKNCSWRSDATKSALSSIFDKQGWGTPQEFYHGQFTSAYHFDIAGKKFFPMRQRSMQGKFTRSAVDLLCYKQKKEREIIRLEQTAYKR